MNRLPQIPRVAFQGERGAFSEEAATKLLGKEIRLVPRSTFEALFSSIDEGIADYLLAPIENTLVGSVDRVYDLLFESSLLITAEVIISVAQHLIGCPGVSLAEIQTVESHPVALAQCERFFAEHPQVRRITATDSAGSVARVIEGGDRTRAAIAGRAAAEFYGGSIVRENLEDHLQNYTRFILLAHSPASIAKADKVSLVLKLHDRPGALHSALAPFARRGINLLNLNSRPIKGHPWQKRFFLEFQVAASEPLVKAAIDELHERADEVRLLGCYQSAQTDPSNK